MTDTGDLSCRVSARVTAADRDALENISQANNLTMSYLVLQAIRRYIAQGVYSHQPTNGNFMHQVICNYCGNEITNGIAHVVIAFPTVDDKHFHLVCWQKTEEEREELRKRPDPPPPPFKIESLEEQEGFGEREARRLAELLGGGWKVVNCVMPVVILSVPEALAVERRLSPTPRQAFRPTFADLGRLVAHGGPSCPDFNCDHDHCRTVRKMRSEIDQGLDLAHVPIGGEKCPHGNQGKPCIQCFPQGRSRDRG